MGAPLLPSRRRPSHLSDSTDDTVTAWRVMRRDAQKVLRHAAHDLLSKSGRSDGHRNLNSAVTVVPSMSRKVRVRHWPDHDFSVFQL